MDSSMNPGDVWETGQLSLCRHSFIDEETIWYEVPCGIPIDNPEPECADDAPDSWAGDIEDVAYRRVYTGLMMMRAWCPLCKQWKEPLLTADGTAYMDEDAVGSSMSEYILSPLVKVDATFTPRRVDDLTAGAAQWIGWRGIWEASWVIEEGQGGASSYVGEWHMTVVPPSPLNFHWAPSGDLTIHGVVEP